MLVSKTCPISPVAKELDGFQAWTNMQHLLVSLQTLRFMKTLPETDTNIISEKAVNLVRKTKFSKLLILDLDETLVHAVPAT